MGAWKESNYIKWFEDMDSGYCIVGEFTKYASHAVRQFLVA